MATVTLKGTPVHTSGELPANGAKATALPNTVVLVVSADLPFAAKRFCTTEGLENVVPLSLMRSKKFAEDYGVLLKDGPLAGLAARAVVVLDEQDRVVYT